MKIACILGFLAAMPVLLSGVFHKPAETNVVSVFTCLFLALFIGFLWDWTNKEKQGIPGKVFVSWGIFAALGIILWPIIDYLRK